MFSKTFVAWGEGESKGKSGETNKELKNVLGDHSAIEMREGGSQADRLVRWPVMQGINNRNCHDIRAI